GLGPARLCRRFGLSRTRLYRLFEPFGGVAGYIREQRLDRAFRELAERDLGQRRLVEVALECGFDSQSHFCRLFRQRFGMTPGEAMEQGRSARARRSLVDGEGPSRPEFRDWLLSL
ncbi:MAG: helix-turn-helix transcriptional regulator, partial [Alloalcanivorax venustensis]